MDLNNLIHRLQDYARNYALSEDEEMDILEAISVLRNQEPRVLTIQELMSVTKPVYIDYRYLESGVWALSMGFTPEYFLFNSAKLTTLNHKVNLYGKYWRVWTDKPNDKQRNAIRWEN